MQSLSTTPRTISGADLPAEIIQRAIEFCMPGDISLIWETLKDNKLKEFKQGLARCSLTCRHWAKTLRPKLFMELRLHTPQDVAELLDFMGSSVSLSPPIRMCIQRMTYEILEPQIPPWIRLYELSRNTPKARLSLRISGPQTSRKSRIFGKSLLTNFPRTLPPSIFQFRHIHLSGVDFESSSDFVGLFHNSMKLDRCILQDLTIDGGQETLAIPRRVARQQPLKSKRIELQFNDVAVDVTGSRNQFALACAVILPRNCPWWRKMDWASTVEIMKLVPSEYRLCDFELFEPEQFSFSGAGYLSCLGRRLG